MRPENTRVWRKGLRHAVRTHPRFARPAPDDIAVLDPESEVQFGVDRWLEREAATENETQPAESDAEA